MNGTGNESWGSSVITINGGMGVTIQSDGSPIYIKDSNTGNIRSLSNYPIQWSAIANKNVITGTRIGAVSYLNGSVQYGTIGISVYNFKDKSTKYYLFDSTGVWKEFTIGIGFSFDEYSWVK